MQTRRSAGWFLCLALTLPAAELLHAGDANPPAPVLSVPGTTTNGQKRVSWTPYPAAQEFKLLSTTNLSVPFSEDVSGNIDGYDWTGPFDGLASFYRLQVTPLSSNALLSATVLNRLTYGPSPDDVERINSVGPQAFIDEQLNWDQIAENLDTTPPIVNTPITPPTQPALTNWIRISATGGASGTFSNLLLYLSQAGRVYVDDIRVVAGAIPDTGPNLLADGDFENGTLAPPWTVNSPFTSSVITNSPTPDGLSASGTNCLLLIGTAGGSSLASSVWAPFDTNGLLANQQFTISLSYLPVQNTSNTVFTVRLAGSATIRNTTLPGAPNPPPTPPTPPVSLSPIYSKLTNAAPPLPGISLPPANVSLSDLRAYHILHSIQSKRQLYEIMVQFFDNHFSTQYQKTKDYFDGNLSNVVTNDSMRQNLAVDLEWREHQKWRQALLNPNCNFYDLLKISIESPAMIIYLDTILSSRSAPNENYGREILELSTMGVDNGYVQQDIVEMARVWTGWSVAKKAAASADDPIAAPLADGTNNAGLYVLHFRPSSHTTNAAKRLFAGAVVDPRFGAPWAGQPYSLTINTNAYPGTNGINEGYLVAQHLASLPQTMEFLSVKLCRSFVHENFDFGRYDYRTNSSAEALLVKTCMTAWDTPATDGRKGNIRKVLNVIFDSDLFRGHGASQQKVKTPLELAASTIRALRSISTDTNNWASSTADTDGYGITSPLSRMGSMTLFDKAEPNGWSEFGYLWLNTANLCERMRFAQHVLMPTTSSLKNTDYGTTRNVSDPVKLLKIKLPAASWNDPAAVVDYFLAILYPGEGRANLDMDRDAAISFLNTNESGTSSPFTVLGNTTGAYDGRVRGMVGMLMSLPRFQEQ